MGEGGAMLTDKEPEKRKKGHYTQQLDNIEKYFKEELTVFARGERSSLDEDFSTPIYEALAAIEVFRNRISNRKEMFQRYCKKLKENDSKQLERMKKNLDREFEKEFQMMFQNWLPFIQTCQKYLQEV